MRLCLFAFLFVPTAVFGATKEMVELQRELASLQEQVRTLQTSLTESNASVTALVKEILDVTHRNTAAMTQLETRVSERLDKQLSSVGQPVAVLGAKVDQMSGDFQSLRESQLDLISRIGKLDQKLVDIKNAVLTIQAPPAPPSASNSGPAIPAATLYEYAERDRLGGKAELAIKQFSDYVQMYGDTDKAPDAQYLIGQIHWDQGEWDSAVKDFDAVLERYPTSSRTADAMFMKGQALVKLGRRNDGAKEFRALLTNYPGSEQAPKACTQLKALGLSCPAPVAPARKKKGD